MAVELDVAGRSFYHPRAFYLYFRHGVLDEHGQPATAEIPVFMHEYAHLVQDQTTLFGVIEFIYLMDAIRDIKIHARANPGAPIRVPLEEHPDMRDTWVNCLARIREVAHSIEPWENGIAWAYIDHNTELVVVPCRPPQTMAEGPQAILGLLRRELPKVKARFVDHETGAECIHSIGPREVKEAYSVAVEQQHGGQLHTLDGPEFQYSAVERILAQFGDVSPRQRITICHWALQSQFPGVQFMRIVEHLAVLSTPLPCAEELFEVCRKYGLEHGLEELITHALEGLDEIVRTFAVAGDSDPLTESLRWYSEIASRNLGWCLDSSRSFPLDGFLALDYGTFEEPEKLSFLRFQNDHPIPLMEDPKGGMYATGPGDQAVFLFRGLCHLVSRLWYSNNAIWRCPIFSCPHRMVGNSGCERTPWAKERLPEGLCPYAAAATYLDIYQRPIKDRMS